MLQKVCLTGICFGFLFVFSNGQNNTPLSDKTYNKTTNSKTLAISKNLRSKAIAYRQKKQYLLALNYYLQTINSLKTDNINLNKFTEYLYNIHNEAILIADTISADFNNLDYDVLLSRYFFPLYENTIDLSYQLYIQNNNTVYFCRSIELSEKLRNLIMHESLKNSIITSILNGNPQLASHIKNLSAQTIVLRNKIDTEIQKNKEESIEMQHLGDSLILIQHRSDSLMYFLRRSINANIPSVYQFKINLKKIQSENVAHNKYLIYYFYGDKNLYAFGINGEKNMFVRIPNDTNIPKLIERLHQSLRNSDFPVFAATSAHLYSLLLKPFEPMFNGVNTLVIIPDGLLNFLPFDCLLTENPVGKNNFKQAEYLIKHFRIEYFSSMQAYTNSFDKQINITHKEITYLSPYFNQKLKDDYLRSKAAVIDTFYLNMNELRFSKYLAAELKKNYNIKEYGGARATKNNFISELASPGILHLASHTIFNDSDAMASFIVFSTDTLLKSNNYLSLSDMYGMNIKKDLLILGSCKTGSGIYRKGTGNINIAQAFYFAGCQNLIFTLWQVDDKATNAIFGNFYEELLKSQTVSNALHKAKLRFLTECSPNEANPLYWAGIVYNGNEITLDNSSNRGYYIFILLAALFVLFTIVLTLKRKS